MGNIGSEIYRTMTWKDRDEEQFWRASERALELFELTLLDLRWSRAQKNEIVRVREVFADALTGGQEYDSTLESLDEYLTQFAYVARRKL